VKLRRGTRLPDDARAALPFERGERPLAAAQLADGSWAAATGRALLTSTGRVPWTDVAHAQWYDEEQTLVVDLVPEAGRPVRLALADPGRLPETVHERVMASIVLSRRVAVPGGGAVRLVARSGEAGEVLWQVVPDPGTDLADPAVRSYVDAALTRVRAELG
jgi:hypothetical protein